MPLRDLPTPADRPKFNPQPKGGSPSRLERKVASEKDDAKQLAQFRKDVWERDKGRCVACQKRVIRTLTLRADRAEVHHLRGRNVTPEDRYRVDRAVLLCAVCHEKVQRHELQISVPVSK
jgi:hypothetical protein